MVYISHDLTELQAEKNKQSRSHVASLKEQNIKNCYIRGNKTYINNKSYTTEEFEALEEHPTRRPTSAPVTLDFLGR